MYKYGVYGEDINMQGITRVITKGLQLTAFEKLTRGRLPWNQSQSNKVIGLYPRTLNSVLDSVPKREYGVKI